MFRYFVLLALMAAGLQAAVTYHLRDARFFGLEPGRETTQGGVYTGAPSQLAVNSPVFNALATNQGSPFRLGAYNQVNAAANTDLTFNIAPGDPTNLVSLVQSRITETNVTVTGGSGTGYLLPTFRVQGSFEDNHSSAFGSAVICVGNNSCPLTGLGNSTGGVQNIDVQYTPDIGASTSFTFGTPFTFFFIFSAGISSNTTGTLAPGELIVDLTNGLSLVDIQVVGGNGDPIRGASIHSEFLDLVNTPEPGTMGLLGLGMMAACAARLRRRS